MPSLGIPLLATVPPPLASELEELSEMSFMLATIVKVCLVFRCKREQKHAQNQSLEEWR